MTATVLIFTDMDGTLMDHHTYDHSAALPALNALKLRHVPVIPTTSKTFAELVVLREEIGLNGPFIIENGAAIYFPEGFLPKVPADCEWHDGFWCKAFSQSRQHYVNLVTKLANEFAGQFNHFSAMSTEDICAATGLKADDAERAAQRRFGEPVLWTGSAQQKQQFLKRLTELGVTPLEGGRFIHVAGDTNKGRALQWLNQCYSEQTATHTTTIALGDSNNDVAMLEAADIAVRITSPTHAPPALQKQQNVYTSTLPGPAGWNEVLTHLLDLSL